MLNLILCGPPGSGKGTQAAKLVEKYKLIHISTGDLFRREKKTNSLIWQEVQSHINKGELAPDSITFKLLKAEMDNTPDAVGFIFDGFPRNVNQAELLDKFLKEEENTAVSILLELQVPDKVIIDRILERGKTSGRVDDQKESIVQNRIDIYKSETAPVASYYEQFGKTKRLNGVGAMDEVFGRLSDELDAIRSLS